MKHIIKFIIACLNIAMGFISLWWFILSYAAAINIDHKEDHEIFIPFGVIALIMLPTIIIGINWVIYKYKNREIKSLALIQIVPFLLGVAISLFLTTMRN